MIEELPKLVELQIPVTLKDVLKKWSHQAGNFEDNVPTESREKLYINALMALFVQFSLSHDNYNDENFVRIFRFFKDAGFLKRVSEQSSIYERYKKLNFQIP